MERRFPLGGEVKLVGIGGAPGGGSVSFLQLPELRGLQVQGGLLRSIPAGSMAEVQARLSASSA
jgi:hypothetical protein